MVAAPAERAVLPAQRHVWERVPERANGLQVLLGFTLQPAQGRARRRTRQFLLGPRIEQVQPPRVAFVTIPCYGIIVWTLGSSVAKAP